MVSFPYETKWTEPLKFVGCDYWHRCQNKSEVKHTGIQKFIAHAGCSDVYPTGRV